MLGARGQPAGRAVTVALVVADERDPATVPLLIAERRPQERQDELGGLLDAVLPGAHRDDIRVVVLAGQLRRLPVPHQGGGGAGHFVRRDLPPVAAPADDDPERTRLGDGPLSHLEAEGRVVVLRVVLERATVDRLVPGLGERLLQVLLELQSGVIRTDEDAHAGESVRLRPWWYWGSMAGAGPGSAPGWTAGRSRCWRCRTSPPSWSYRTSRWSRSTCRSGCRTTARAPAMSPRGAVSAGPAAPCSLRRCAPCSWPRTTPRPASARSRPPARRCRGRPGTWCPPFARWPTRSAIPPPGAWSRCIRSSRSARWPRPSATRRSRRGERCSDSVPCAP